MTEKYLNQIVDEIITIELKDGESVTLDTQKVGLYTKNKSVVAIAGDFSSGVKWTAVQGENYNE